MTRFFDSRLHKEHLARSEGLGGEIRYLNDRTASAFDMVENSVWNAGVLWKPSGGGDAETWEDVVHHLSHINAPPVVWVLAGETYEIPAGDAPYAMRNGVFRSALGAQAAIHIADGAQLLDCAGGEGAILFVGHSTDDAHPPFDYSAFHPPLLGTGLPAIFLSQFGGGYWKQLGTSPMIIVPDGAFMVYAQRYGGGIDTASTPLQEVIRLGDLSILLFTMIGQPSQLTENAITGPAGANIIIQHDGNAQAPPPGSLPNFAGNVFNVPFGNEGGVGPTSFRPAPLFGPLQNGCKYWDTDLLKALWLDTATSDWRDAAGVVVPLSHVPSLHPPGPDHAARRVRHAYDGPLRRGVPHHRRRPHLARRQEGEARQRRVGADVELRKGRPSPRPSSYMHQEAMASLPASSPRSSAALTSAMGRRRLPLCWKLWPISASRATYSARSSGLCLPASMSAARGE